MPSTVYMTSNHVLFSFQLLQLSESCEYPLSLRLMISVYKDTF